MSGDLPRIIGLNGVARAGKDTVADILVDLYGYRKASFSDILNKALYTLDRAVGKEAGVYVKREGEDTRYLRYADLVDDLGYEGAKEHTGVRKLLQAMGTEVGRDLLGKNIWVDALFNNLDGGPVVITNVRFPNEAAAVWLRNGVVWEVTRSGYTPALGHISDTALDAIKKDAYISNNGTKTDLANRVIDLLFKYSKEHARA